MIQIAKCRAVSFQSPAAPAEERHPAAREGKLAGFSLPQLKKYRPYLYRKTISL